MDGHALGAALTREHPDVRLVAVTGYSGDAERKRSSAGDFEMHFVKPIDVALLLAHLQGNRPSVAA